MSDEIITSRAGARIRVGNTDAEGRMVMTDVLCRMKERVRGGNFLFTNTYLSRLLLYKILYYCISIKMN